MDDHLKDGDELLLKGSAGALFRVTVGAAFTPADVAARLRTGEWSHPGDKPPKTTPRDQSPATELLSSGPAAEQAQEPEQGKADPNRPGLNDPKSAWVAHVAGLKHMSIEDASSYTKADLIEMAS